MSNNNAQNLLLQSAEKCEEILDEFITVDEIPILTERLSAIEIQALGRIANKQNESQVKTRSGLKSKLMSLF